MSHKMMLDGANRAVLDGDDELSRYVSARGFSHDGMMREAIMPHIAPGDVVVDGGAALGDHTVPYIQRVGPSGLVFAFEPHPEYFRCLRHNAPTAITIPCALWNSRNEVQINEPNGNVGGSFISSVGIIVGDSAQESFKARTMLLDDFGLERVAFIKLDLEGGEYFALEGMRETVARCRPKIVVEMRVAMMSRYGINPAMMLEWFVARDYRVTSVCGNPDPASGECDALAVPL